MEKNNRKMRASKTTIVLSVILVMLILVLTTVFFIYPFCKRYYILHRNYDIYGGLTDELTKSEFYTDLTSAESICFLGDSITYGSVTEGIPWYQPLIPYTKGDISSFSFTGYTVTNLIDNRDKITFSDVYVVAIGLNDIIFYDRGDAAFTAEDFAKDIKKLTAIIRDLSPNAKIYYIAPWVFLGFDDTYNARGDEYRETLENCCKEIGCTCINPEPAIKSVFFKDGVGQFMANDFHPNSPEGIGLYSYAVLKAAHDLKE